MSTSTIVAPCLMKFKNIGSRDLGYISAVEYPKDLPFPIKRVYWTYFTPNDVERGNHAHRYLHQIIVAVSGRITFRVEGPEGDKEDFVLDNPNTGLYLPPMHWRTINFSHNAVLLCLASAEFQKDDYIRDYDEFKSLSLMPSY